MCSMDRKNAGQLIESKRVSYILMMYLITLCVTNRITCDVSVAPNADLIDLSWPYNQNTLIWVEFRNYTMDVISEGSEKYTNPDGSKVWTRAENIALAIHTGTHMDAPFHFARDKWSVDEIPIEHFVDRPLVVMDVQKQVFKNRDYQVTEHDFHAWEQENGRIPEGAVVFINTGFAKFWPDRLKYLNLPPGSKAIASMRFPGMHPDAAEWLVKNRLVVGVGIDALSIDSGASRAFYVHQILLDRNMFIIENVNGNIAKVPAVGSKVNIFPLKFEGASGSPCRVIVNLNSSQLASASVILIFVSFFLQQLHSHLTWTNRYLI